MNGTTPHRARCGGAAEVEITAKRLDEMIRWHGTDERALPPARTLQHLSRDTVAALSELARTREAFARLRTAIGRAFWAASRSELNAILLDALGPPPDDAETAAETGGPRENGSGHSPHPSESSRPSNPRTS